jgi:hypothetical protein
MDRCTLWLQEFAGRGRPLPDTVRRNHNGVTIEVHPLTTFGAPRPVFVRTRSYVGPALHICRYPVPPPKDVFPNIVVPYPRLQPWEPRALGVEALLLHEGAVGWSWSVLPTEVAPDLCVPWAEDPDSPLLLPVSVLIERRKDREWGAQLTATPSTVGVTASRDTLAAVAWSVLCRVPRVVIVECLAALSCLADRYRSDPSVLERLVRVMCPPSPVRGRLLACARAGNPILNPRGVRWVLCELVAASDEERATRARWRPATNDERSVLARAWFRSVRGTQPPGFDEILFAVWMLHEVFDGADLEGDADNADRLLAVVTALGFRFGSPGGWAPLLNRWREIWSIPDTHAAVAQSPIPPSALRAAYARQLGVSVEQWLAGNWALCVRWWMAMGEAAGALARRPAELFRFPINGTNQFSSSFITAFNAHSVGTLEQFAADVRDEAGNGYRGLGSLPQWDSLTCRNHPVVELPDGRLVPLSVELVAERATALHRLLLGFRHTASSGFGLMFEAYVADLLDRLRARHMVVTEAEITGILGHSCRRGDALVAYQGNYLAIETSVQNLSRGVASGDAESIIEMAERYQTKADQAIATIRHLSTIATALGCPAPTAATHLVVSETPVPPSPSFLRKLRELRPDRTEKFICSASDLELLVELSIVGWDVPGAITAWQRHLDLIPLDVQLGNMVRILGPRRKVDSDPIERWMRELPYRDTEAA